MKAFPFDSQIVGQDENGMPIYDRASSASEFARMLGSFFRDGVFGETMCAVVEGAGMTATVGAGSMLIQGRYGWIDTPETVTFDPSETNKSRIDTVVLRLDLTSGVNNIVTAVVKGTPAIVNPVAPTLTRDGTVWELGIADVRIYSGSTSVSQVNIVDTRLDPSRCGIVAAILAEVNTEELFIEFNKMLETMRKNLQGVYEGVEKANIITRSVTLSADGWSETEPYTQRVLVQDILHSDDPFIDADMSGATTLNQMRELRDNWGCILKYDPENGAISFVVSSIPVIDIPIKVKVVR